MAAAVVVAGSGIDRGGVAGTGRSEAATERPLAVQSMVPGAGTVGSAVLPGERSERLQFSETAARGSHGAGGSGGAGAALDTSHNEAAKVREFQY